MAHIHRTALVAYSAQQMYQLVDNISDYPNFLPWCCFAEELARTEQTVRASIMIDKGPLKKRFTTLNTLQDNTIEMNLIDGPFRQLHGFWQFDPLGVSACKVSLKLDYEFSNRLLTLAVDPVFNQVANSLVDSFVQRAHHLYASS